MNDRQEAKLSMYIAVRDLLTANLAVVTPLPSFNTFNTQFNTGVDQIQTIRTQQELSRKGVGVSKSQAKKDLITLAVDIARKVAAFAQVGNNAVLLAEVSYTQSDLTKSADTILKDRCEIIRQRAATNQAALANYGVTAAMVTNLQTLITAWNTAIPKPKAAVADKKLSTGKLTTLFTQNDLVLKTKMDALIEILRQNNVDFYAAYRNARNITNEHPTRKLAVRVSVSDVATGLPLGMVVAKVSGLNKMKKTTLKGKFQMKFVNAGTYTFNFTKNGYKPVSAVVNVNDGERSDLVVEMENV